MPTTAAEKPIVRYESDCRNPKCELHIYLTEDRFAELAGPIVKAAIDRGEDLTHQVAVIMKEADMAAAATSSSPSSSTAAGRYSLPPAGDRMEDTIKKAIKMTTCPNPKCKSQLAVSFYKRCEYTRDNLPAALFVDEMLIDDAESIVETDPLMQALERVKNAHDHDPTHAEIGTTRVLWYCRRLVEPVHAFLRVVLFRSCEQYIMGSVSIFRLPASVASKQQQNWFKQMWGKLFPIALAADFPFCVFPIALISFLFFGTRLIFDFFVLAATTTSSVEDSDSSVVQHRHTKKHHHHHHNNNKRHHNHHATTAALLEDNFSLSSFLATPGNYLHLEETARSITPFTAFLCLLAVFLIFRIAIREPGYLIPHPTSAMAPRRMDSSIVHRAEINSSSSSSLEKSSNNNTNNNNEAEEGESPFPVPPTPVNPDPELYCKICKIERPDRSYTHCRFCGLCAKEIDHHCLVVGSCVAARNVSVFIYFLMSVCFCSIVNAIQIVMFAMAAYHRITVTGYFWGTFIFLLTLYVTNWTGFMLARTLQSVQNDMSLKELKAKEMKEAGVPKKRVEIGTTAASSKEKNWTFFWQKPYPVSLLSSSAVASSYSASPSSSSATAAASGAGGMHSHAV